MSIGQGAGDALIAAADRGHTAVMKAILQHWSGEDDMVRSSSILIIPHRLLSSSWSTVVLQDQRFLHRALAFAARSGVVASVRMLLEYGADPAIPVGPVSFLGDCSDGIRYRNNLPNDF